MSKKKQFLVFDTETTLNSQEVFNIGWQKTTDKGFPIDEKEYWIEESLVNDQPWYPTNKPEGAISVSKNQVRHYLAAEEEDIDAIFAYNCNFDKTAVKKSLEFTFEKPMKDLWTAAAIYICNDEYIKWARENGKVTEKGNIKTSAESVYQYISGQPEFEEAHTAKEDSKIETEILKHLIAKGVVVEDVENHGAPWRIVKKKADQLIKEEKGE